MEATLKTILKRALKQAIIGSVTSYAAAKVAAPSFNLHTGIGWAHLAIVFFTPIGAAEVAYFWPKLMAWAQSPDN